MYLTIIKVIGTAVYMYLVWRKLRQDYKSREVVGYLWLVMIGFFLGGRLVFGVLNWRLWQNWWDWLLFWKNPGINYLGAYGGWLWVTYWMAKNFDWKIYPLLEDLTKTTLLLFIFYVFGKPNFLVMLSGTYLLTVWLEKKYRSFGWYKSGKKGFAWLAANLFLGVFLAIITGQWLYLIISLLSLVGLVILGGR